MSESEIVGAAGEKLEAPKPIIEMQTWEYMVVPNMVASRLNPEKPQPGWDKNLLDAMGADGWEVCSSTMMFLLLKRPMGEQWIQTGSTA